MEIDNRISKIDLNKVELKKLPVNYNFIRIAQVPKDEDVDGVADEIYKPKKSLFYNTSSIYSHSFNKPISNIIGFKEFIENK